MWLRLSASCGIFAALYFSTWYSYVWGLEWFTHHLSGKCDFLFSPTHKRCCGGAHCNCEYNINFCVKTYCTQKCVHLNIWELHWHLIAKCEVILRKCLLLNWKTKKYRALNLYFLNSYIFQRDDSVGERLFNESSRRFPHKQITDYLKGITFIVWLNDCFWT